MGSNPQLCTFSELKKLQVININNGKNLGTTCDLELDLNCGRITAIFVPKKVPFCDILQKNINRKIRISWCDIEQIGLDAILVRICCDDYDFKD